MAFDSFHKTIHWRSPLRYRKKPSILNMHTIYKNVFFLSCLIALNCGGRNKTIETFNFPPLSYNVTPYSASLPRLNPATSHFYLTSTGYIENKAPSAPKTWGPKLDVSQESNVSPFLKRELQRKTGRTQATLLLNRDACGEADALMAELASTLRLPISGVSVIGNFTSEGFLTCDSFEEALLQRVNKGATHVLGPQPKTRITSLPAGVRYAPIQTIDQAVELLGGPKHWEDDQKGFSAKLSNGLKDNVSLQNKKIEQHIKKLWPYIIEISNGAGVKDEIQTHAQSALDNAQKAKTSESLEHIFSAHHYWSMTRFHTSQASSKEPTVEQAPPPSNVLFSKTVLFLKNKNPWMAKWLQDETLFEKDNTYFKNATLATDVSKWFQPLSERNKFTDVDLLKKSTFKALHQLMQLRGPKPLLPLFMWFTLEQVQINEKDTLELYRVTKRLTELYTAAWFSSAYLAN